MNALNVSRREFVGAVAGAVPLAGYGWSKHDPRDSRTGAGAAQDVFVIGALPLLSPDRDIESFRATALAARAAGADLVFVPVVVEPDDAGAMFRNLVRLHQYVADVEAQVGIVSSDDDVSRFKSEGRLGILPASYGMEMFPGSTPEQVLSGIRGIRALGIRIVQPVHNWKNRYGDGCFGRTNRALTTTGRLAISALNDADIVVDLSHMGVRSSLEALDVSRHPVLFTQSNAARIHPHGVNLSDAQIDACARTGGVIGISAFPGLVSDSESPTIEDMLRHVDYLAERVGTDHVGLGIDLDDRSRARFPSDPIPAPPYRFPGELRSVSGIATLRESLRARGYVDLDVDKILGDNFLRVLRHVWREPS